LFTNDLDYKENRSSIVPAAEEVPQYDQNGNRLPPQNPQNNMNNNAMQQNQKQLSAQNVFVKEIRARIDTYFRIVLRNVRDTVPKTVGYFLVKMSQEKLQFELYTRINASPQIADALGEPKNITERRVTLSTIIKTLSDSLRVLQRDPE
jgi:dynamin 1-like protein